MKSPDRAKLKNALIAAYQGKHIAFPGDYWELKVMNHIRSLGPLKDDPGDMTNFVWRFAAAAAFPIVILSAYLILTGFDPEYEMAELIFNDPSALTFISDFGNIL